MPCIRIQASLYVIFRLSCLVSFLVFLTFTYLST